MSLPISRGAYRDCYKVMDAAIEDEKGVRIEFPDIATANYFRMRVHQARSLSRKLNNDIYDKGHPLHDTSLYDPLVARIVNHDETFWLYLEKNRIEDLGEIQPLSEVPQLVHHRQIQIPDMRAVDDGPVYEEPEPKVAEPVLQITRRRF